jgi:iron complex transport system ATP-binding protein
MTEQTALLTVAGVTLRGRTRPRLNHVGFELHPGEIVGLVGANGAGKSSLLAACAGLLAVDAGTIHLNTLDVAKASLGALAICRAFVEQQPAIDATYTVYDLVELGRAPHRNGLSASSAQDRTQIQAALEMWGLSAMANQPAGELSGGERRRIDLARAFAQDPMLMLLDEPDAFLDVRTLLQLETHLRAWVQPSKRAALIAVHDLQSAARMCDRVVVLCEGEICATGTPRKAFTAANIQRAFGVEVAISDTDPLSIQLLGAS